MKLKVTTSKENLPEEQRGSATSEFVLLALPLFIPALIFFASISQLARAEMEASMLAREALKAFTTSEDDIQGHLRVRLLLNQYREISARGTNTGSSVKSGSFIENNSDSGHADSSHADSSHEISKSADSIISELSEANRIDYSIRCSTSPCMLPGTEVEITLFSMVNLESEVDSLNNSLSSFWGSGRKDIAKHRTVMASARGFVDKWR